MKYALFWSGGKDSLLALDRARRSGLDLSHLVNIYEGNSGRVRFHGVRSELIRAQADALGMSLVQKFTHPEAFEPVFLSALDELKALRIGGIVFGNIHLADVREWYELRTRAAGFEHIEPLWGFAPGTLVREFVDRGHRSRIVSVNLSFGRREWLGREIAGDFVAELEQLQGVDVCGERGEYHSFAFGGPLFREPICLQSGEPFEMENHLIQELVLAPEELRDDVDKGRTLPVA